MALTLCISAPYFASYRYPLGLGLACPRCPWRVNLRFCPGRGIRCTAAADAGETPGARNKVSASSHSPSWDHAEATKDAFAGWEPLDRDYEIDRRVGFLKIGAGVVLGIACSVIAYTLYPRKGTLHSFVSVTTRNLQKALPSQLSPDESRGAHHQPFDSDNSSTPSSNEWKQEVHGENAQPDPASTSDVQEEKKTAPGQDSFPSKDVAKFSDEEDDLSTGSFTDSDAESKDPSNSEKVDKKTASLAKESVQPSNDALNPTSVVKQNDALGTDDKSVVVPSGTPISSSDLTDRENGESGDISVGKAGSPKSTREAEESSSAVAKHEDQGVAPSSPSTAAQARSGSIVVPATVDSEQEQALAALQALKVIEPGVEAGAICTRREYARWLIAITGTLARSPAQKVFPAMYIETESELAFNDVVPEDRDFPYIQGLAEAGLISSNLSRHDADANGRSTDGAIFLPDSPLSRQDLVSWKVALGGQTLQATDKQKMKAKTGFIDIDRVSDDALPFLAADLQAGERSIISTVFGYTRRFQPGKPVTRGQAALALVTGEAADIVAEELTRLEADDIAEAAVIAELSMDGRAQKQVDEYFNTELKLEKDAKLAAENRLEEVKSELERLMKKTEDQRLSNERFQAAVETERDLLHRFRQEMDEQLQTLTTLKVEVGIDRNRLEWLRKEAEERAQTLADHIAEVEVENKALMLARSWAEDEAKKARAHAILLEEEQKRWEGHGIKVQVNKDLDDDNIPALGWQYGGPKTELNKFAQRPPVQDILAMAGDLKSKLVERLVHLLEALGRALAAVQQQIVQSFKFVQQEGAESLRLAGGKVHTLQQDSFSIASRKVKDVQDATQSTVVGVSSSVTQGTRKIADRFQHEAGKFAGKFKS